MFQRFALVCAFVASVSLPASASVTVGGLTYSIRSVSVQSTVGPDGIEEHASGEFIIVRLSIKNVGKEPADISASDFKLTQGDSTYDSSSVTVGMEGGFFLTKLNPGVSHSGILIFDVPAHTAATKYSMKVYGNNSSESRTIQL